MKKTLYLVDVSSLFFRAFYAIRPLTSPSGLPVNAIYGFTSMLLKLIKEEKPSKLVFCYDRKEPSFRKDIYQEYKANRTEMPEELGVQIPYIKKIADLMGIPSLEKEGFEADDLIGTLSSIGKENGYDVYIVSGDKDFAQLLNGSIFIFDTMKNVKYDSRLAKEKWGIDPCQMIDYLALVGDSSDNVPGVSGIGPKGAQKLLEEFGSLEKIYENLEKITSKSIREKLERDREMAFLSQKLVTISLDVPLSVNMSDYQFSPMQRQALVQLFSELNFQNFMKSIAELNLLEERSEVSDSVSAVLAAESISAQQALSGELQKAQNNLDWITDAEEFFSEAKNEVGGFFIDEKIYLLNSSRQALDVNDFLFPQVQKILRETKDLNWWGFDLKTLWHKLGLENPEMIWDSQLAAYSLKTGDMTSLQRVSEIFLEKAFENQPTALLPVQFELRKVLSEKIDSAPAKIFHEIEKPLAPLLFQMERRGVKLDLEFLRQQSQELAADLQRLEKEILDLAGEKFNVASPKQLSVILFEKLKLPVIKKTKTGLSTDNEVLEKLAHPVAKKVLEYRELAKLKSTYIDALPTLADSNARVHTSLNQALTTTGRLSSTNPNLQNIPIRTVRGQKVRQAFIAEAGKLLLSVDYSQVELRVLAHISGDIALKQAFVDDLDVHAATAAEVFGVKLTEVTSDLRRTAKAINFGIAYGQGAFGLAENLGISRTEAKEIISKYFQKFQGVQHYIESTIQKAHEQGYVETLFGRRRYIDELKSKAPALRSFGERAAINAPIQGTASDLIKIAMIAIGKEVQVPMLLQVHDELIFEAPGEELDREKAKIKQLMENVVQWDVPLKVNIAIGKNWDEAH